jgi:hypothetical protein
MSSRVLLLVESPDPAEVSSAITEAIRRVEWWRFWGRSGHSVVDSAGGWVAVELAKGTRSPGSVSERVSSTLSCRTLLVVTDSISGSEEILLCNKGWNVRWLWYAYSEDYTFANEGDPLEFEVRIKQQRRAEIERELAAMSPEDRAKHMFLLNKGNLLPRGKDFARELGCPIKF